MAHTVTVGLQKLFSHKKGAHCSTASLPAAVRSTCCSETPHTCHVKQIITATNWIHVTNAWVHLISICQLTTNLWNAVEKMANKCLIIQLFTNIFCSCWSSECECHAGTSRRWQETLEEMKSWVSSKSTGDSSKWSWSLFVYCTIAMYLIVATAEKFVSIEHPLAVRKNCRISVVSQTVHPAMLQLQHKVISKWPSQWLPVRHLQTYLLKV